MPIFRFPGFITATRHQLLITHWSSLRNACAEAHISIHCGHVKMEMTDLVDYIFCA